MLTPSIGRCLMPLIVSGCRDAGRFEDGRHDVDDVVELPADAAHVLDVAGPGHGHALRRPAEMRRHLLHPFERRVHRPGPAAPQSAGRSRSDPQNGYQRYWSFTGTGTPLKVVNSFGVPLSMPSALAPLSPLM